MSSIASQITCLIIVFSADYSDADQRKHQSSASLAFVRGIHRRPVNSPHKWPVTRKMFPFDDVIIVLTGPQCIDERPPNHWGCFTTFIELSNRNCEFATNLQYDCVRNYMTDPDNIFRACIYLFTRLKTTGLGFIVFSPVETKYHSNSAGGHKSRNLFLIPVGLPDLSPS